MSNLFSVIPQFLELTQKLVHLPYFQWQTMKTKIKCRIKQHFIRAYTVCKDTERWYGRNKYEELGLINDFFPTRHIFSKILISFITITFTVYFGRGSLLCHIGTGVVIMAQGL